MSWKRHHIFFPRIHRKIVRKQLHQNRFLCQDIGTQAEPEMFCIKTDRHIPSHFTSIRNREMLDAIRFHSHPSIWLTHLYYVLFDPESFLAATAEDATSETSFNQYSNSTKMFILNKCGFISYATLSIWFPFKWNKFLWKWKYTNSC